MATAHNKAWTDSFARWGVQRTWTVLAVGLVLALLGLWGTIKLKVDPDLKALLPPSEPSVARLNELRPRMGAQNDLIVSIGSPDREANLKFGRALSERMRAMPELRFVLFERDMKFFEDRALLYLPLGDLLDMRRKVLDRLKEETEKELVEDVDAGAPAAPDPAKAAEDDPLDVDRTQLAAKYFGTREAPTRFMEADEGRIVVVRARPIEQTTNVDFCRKLTTAMDKTIQELDPKSFHPEMAVTLEGEYVSRVSESKSIRGDVLAAAGFTLGLLLFVIALYFRRGQATVIVVVPVIVSTLLTQLVGVLAYGTYNLVTTFMFAIVLGLGIEFGIHCLARYGHERERGHSLADALQIALSSTGAAVTTGGVTTLAVFFLLALGKFRGFSQFGIMAGSGVLLALLMNFLMMPALVAAIDRVSPWKKKARPTPDEDAPLVPKGPSLPPRRALGYASVLLGLSLLFAGLAIANGDQIAFEYDFGKLGARPKPAPPGQVERPTYRDAVGRGTTFAPAVALCDTGAQCEEMTRTLEAVKRAHKPRNAPPPPAPKTEVDEDDPFAEPEEKDPFEALTATFAKDPLLKDERALVDRLGKERSAEVAEFLQGWLSLWTFVPAHQEEKLAIVRDIKERVDEKREGLGPDARKKVDKLYAMLEVDKPIRVPDLPAWVTDQLKDSEGAVGRFVILWNRGAKADYNDAKRLYDAFFNFPVTGASVPVAANYFVLVEVIDTLGRDGPIVLGAAIIAVLLSLTVFFRSPVAAVITLLPLMLSLAWLLGLHALFDVKLNMFSVIAFPLLVGMSIDQGVHVYHRWRETPDLRLVIRETGSANVLTTFTTIIGFGGLWFADNVGIQSLGSTASVGTVLGLIGSCVTLPSLLLILDRMRRNRTPQVESTADVT